MTEIIETPGSETKSQAQEENEGRKDLMKALVLCVVAVIVVRSFLFEPFKIPSSSMVPTLIVGDHIFVSKFNYGLSLPFTKIEFVRWGQPSRGEVIVFLNPKDESLHYIKRVVGIPGDRIEFKGKDLYINSELISKIPVTDLTSIKEAMGRPDFSGLLYKENLDRVIHYVKYVESAGYEFSRTPQVWVVPPDRFFVAGDNRDDSYDSRSWGFVPRENIKGRAQMIWLSLDQDQGWNMKKVRWQRCGTLIH